MESRVETLSFCAVRPFGGREKSGRVLGWVGGGQQVGYTAPGGASGCWGATVGYPP